MSAAVEVPHLSLSSLQPVDREPLIYHMDSGARRCGNQQDLPDEFFEVTVDDIRKRFAQLKSERWDSFGKEREWGRDWG